MQKVVSKTADMISRFGEKLERRLSTGDDDSVFGYQRSSSTDMLNLQGSGSHRPLDGNYARRDSRSSNHRSGIYDRARNSSTDNLAASPAAFSSFSNYRQNPMGNPYSNKMMGPAYGGGFGGAQNYGYPMGAYGGGANVSYAPEYYVAERRQLELVPAPPPRVVQQPVPVPVPVDRPVPRPYPVEVARPVPVDRPVPYPVPTAVPVDRPVPVPVPVPSPPPPPVQVPVPVPVPTPVPQYVPVGVPVPSPPPSPVMVENSVTHTQRWVANAPSVFNQQSYIASSPVMMNQQRYLAGSPVAGMNPCIPYARSPYF